MQKLFKMFLVQLFILSISNQLIAEDCYLYDTKAFNEIDSGCKQMRRSDLQYAPLNNDRFNDVILEGSWLTGASFRESELKRANLKKVKAQGASFRWADLEDADLSHGNFSKGLFFGVNLKGVKAFDSNFAGVRGLTNEDKDYLNEQQAINVPDHLTKEEFELERLQVELECRNRIKEWIDYLGTPIRYSGKKLEVLAQVPLSIFIKSVELLMLPVYYPLTAINDLGMRIFQGKRNTSESLQRLP